MKMKNGYRLSVKNKQSIYENLHPPFLHSARMQGGEPPKTEGLI